jgi:hypothetical protein
MSPEPDAVSMGDAAGRRPLLLASGGAVLALVVAVALFTRFSIDGNLWRDEAVYAYGGQQFARGVPMYVSIFDAKTPLPAILSGLGALGGHWLGVYDVYAIRGVFFAFACLAVVAVYLLGLWLWRSPLAGIVGAVTFASFKGFAQDALGGPQAKTPGIFFAVLSMALLVRRRWFWGAFAASLAFLVWQPLAIYAIVAVVWAVLSSDAGQRWRAGGQALAGAAIPVAATALYFWIAGALPQLVEATVSFPLTGVSRASETITARVDHIVSIVNRYYGDTRALLWLGLVLVVGLLCASLLRARSHIRGVVKEPYVGVVIATFLCLAAFTLSDFQGYPDVFPLLPYAAIGLGGATALLVRRIGGVRLRGTATAVTLAGVAILGGLSWSWYSGARETRRSLTVERAVAAKISGSLKRSETLYALGDPTPLVLTGRRNPSRFIYLSSGVAEWVIRRTPGGLEGWEARIRASKPAMVTISDWDSPLGAEVKAWLASAYGNAIHRGHWLVFITPAIRARIARRAGQSAGRTRTRAPAARHPGRSARADLKVR